jgi:magnesium-transporting ATPase (P-type)
VFRSGAHGLSAEEAAARYLVFGPNLMPAAAPRSAAMRLLSQFHNLLIYILIAAAAISVLLGHLVDAGVILAVVILNAVIGFIQEGRAERSLDAIRRMIDPHASLMREGRRTTVRADMITPGDVVLLEAGDRVPADLRLVQARNLRIDEAPLTGESAAVEKAIAPVHEAAVLADRTSMAYSGTLVAAGRGTGVAIGTGQTTELGRIGSMIGGIEVPTTHFTSQINALAKTTTFVTLAVSAAVFFFAVAIRDYAYRDAFMTMVGLAVAAIPEGLPAVITITLAIGVRRMAARNAVIRKLPAVETLGSVSVICTDKTGTLTRNEMTARAVLTADRSFEVGGAGYEPVGKFASDGADIDPGGQPILTDLVTAALLCNDAALSETEAGWRVDGDPMEGALIALAVKAGLEPEQMRRQNPRTDEIPFDAEHRFMATLHHRHDGGTFIVVKGAPERILAMCAHQREETGDRPVDARAWHRRIDTLAANGFRILAFATLPAETGKQDLAFADVDGGGTFLGIVGLIDPPREEAIEAIVECRRAGIRVIMITGDHAATAREIARQLGLAADAPVLSGREIDGLDQAGLRRALAKTSVFARTTPEHKLRLVEALQADGLIVAMTGDGVNDAPALKRADVGIAMGVKGTEAAKDAAKMVLLDDNFASIVAAVREGRTVYDNLMKVISLTLPTNGGEALTILAAIAFGLALPITAVQILWVNMITSVALDLTLTFEPTEPGTMRRPPRPPGQPIITPHLVWRILLVSVLMVAGAFGMFFWAESRGQPLEAARTMAVNTIVVMEVFYLFSLRYAHGTSLTWRGLLGTPAVLIGVAIVVAGQFALTYLPFMQTVFGTQPVRFTDGLAITAAGVALLLLLEVEKRVRLAFSSS